MVVRNLGRYLGAVVEEYETTDFDSDFEQRRALWKAAVVIYEQAGEDDAEPWLNRLRDASLGLIKPTRIETTIRSAHRRVLGNA